MNPKIHTVYILLFFVFCVQISIARLIAQDVPSSSELPVVKDPIDEKLKSSDPDTQIEAMIELRRHGKITSTQTALLFNIIYEEIQYFTPQEKASIAALHTIKILEPGKLLQELKRAATKDRSSQVRGRAVEEIGGLGAFAKSALPELREALSDPELFVNMRAARALGRFGIYAKEDVPKLVEYTINGLGSPLSGAEGLGLFGEHAKEAVPTLIKALASSKNETKYGAILALGNLEKYSQAALPELKDVALNNSESYIREAAGRAIEQINEIKAVPSLPELKSSLANSDPSARIRALEFLGDLGIRAKETFPQIINIAINDKNPDVRAHAFLALVKLNEPGNLNEAVDEVMPDIKRALTDTDSAIRKHASEIMLIVSEREQTLPKLTESGSICEAIRMLGEHKLWNSTDDYRAAFAFPEDAWDTAISSLQGMYLTKVKTINAPIKDAKECTRNSEETIEKFAASILSFTDRIGLENSPFWSGSEIYAKIYRLGFLKLNGRKSDISKYRTSLEKDISELKELGNSGGSAFNTYAYGASIIALGDTVSKPLLDQLESWVSKSLDPMALQYSPHQHRKVDSRRGSSSRNIPIHLALYLNRERLTSKENRPGLLLEAITNWKKYAGSLSAEVTRDGTHAGIDSLAPYYFYSSLPYVTASLKLLEKDKSLSDEQKKEVAKIKKDLREKLPKLIDSSGLQLLEGGKEYKKTMYHSSPGYNYPLYGLALIPLLEESDPCYKPHFKDDYGIVFP